MEVLAGFEIQLTPKSCALKTEPSLHTLVPILINYGRSLFSAVLSENCSGIDRSFYKKPTITGLGQGSSQIGEIIHVEDKIRATEILCSMELRRV